LIVRICLTFHSRIGPFALVPLGRLVAILWRWEPLAAKEFRDNTTAASLVKILIYLISLFNSSELAAEPLHQPKQVLDITFVVLVVQEADPQGRVPVHAADRHVRFAAGADGF
jgi:hypothetical protein